MQLEVLHIEQASFESTLFAILFISLSRLADAITLKPGLLLCVCVALANLFYTVVSVVSPCMRWRLPCVYVHDNFLIATYM